MLGFTRWMGFGPTVINVKGPWCEIISATPYDSSGLVFYVEAMALTTSEFHDALFDIGIGPEGQEVVLVADIAMQAHANYVASQGMALHVPIPLSKGTRIVSRWQLNIMPTGSPNAASARPCVQLLRGAATPLFGRCETIGANTSRSGGTPVYIPALNTWSPSYTALSESGFACDVKAFIPRWQGQGPSDDGVFGSYFGFQVCVGAQGKETPIYQSPTITAIHNGINAIFAIPRVDQPIPISIPKGVRVTARGWKNGNGMGNYRDLTIIGFS